MSLKVTARSLTIWFWIALVLSLPAWMMAGYPWPICALAALPLLAPLNGLLRGRRHTYAWATLFAIPYLAFALTELLVNPAARWVAPRHDGERFYAGYWDGDRGRLEHDHHWDRGRDRDYRDYDRH